MKYGFSGCLAYLNPILQLNWLSVKWFIATAIKEKLLIMMSAKNDSSKTDTVQDDPELNEPGPSGFSVKKVNKYLIRYLKFFV